MKILPFYKDLILQYATNLAEVKGNSGAKNKLKEQFVKDVEILRDRYPELLFVNYNSILDDETTSSIFDNIKERVKVKHSISLIPDTLRIDDNINGDTIETPGFIKIENGGYICVRYDSSELKKALLNQLLLHLVIQLPIKKIEFAFVDLMGKYDEEFLLKNINPLIYRNRPITSESLLEDLLSRLEKRQFEVAQKYGDYSTYCEQHKTTPMPYEFIVLLDEYYDERYLNRLNNIIRAGYKYGVYVIVCNKIDPFSLPEGCILDPNGKQIYEIGGGFPPDYYGELRHSGTYYNMFEEGDGIRKTPKEDEGLPPMPPMNNYIARGYGDYEVVLASREFKTGSIGTEVQSVFQEKYGIDSFCLDQIMESGSEITLASFATEKQASNYISSLCKEYDLPNGFTYPLNCVFLKPCWRDPGFFGNPYSIALYVPDYISMRLDEFKSDLKFYMEQLGVTGDLFNRMINCLDFGHPLIDGHLYVERFENINTNPNSDDAYEMLANWITERNKRKSDYYIHDFSQNSELWIPNCIIDGFQFSGKAISYWNNITYSEIKKCFYYISNLEKELHDRAAKKWGKDYLQSHLCIGWGHRWIDIEGCGDFYITIRHRPHETRVIWKYEAPCTKGLINFTPITSNKSLLNACINYINQEAVAKEERKAISMDYSKSTSSVYDIPDNEITTSIGMTDTNEMLFRMDLVSHVHSFIIGQSGSGKSVFLHNIIGGAMLNYAPEDLQLYLLDFKLGGVEFNRYQGAKHVKALLVDNSDPQVTLEILRELRNSMAERGKLLRSAGVNNIGEYNKMHQQDRMPHVLVVADECHEMFKADDSIPRQVRNEISDIVIKIAKEGRSQGVHLVFATQTLSGTEISSEIINNVSDFYLLKCAQTDSERLVPNSSTITSELSTGQIYYHHVDEQVKFQAYYTDKEAAEKLMAAIVEKAKDHKSNGEFYFNGAQMFYLDESVKKQIQDVKGKSPVAFLGKAIDISQKDLYIKLNDDFSENVLLLGLNDQEQVTRTTMNLFVSLMMSAKLRHKDIAFKVIDCLNNEEGEVHELLFNLENEGLCEIIERRQRSKFFKDLAQDIQDGTAEETILLILGQDRFRELKMDMELEEGNSNKSSDDDDMMSISDDFFGGDGSSSSSVKTYKDALNVILEKGPDYSVHTLLQLEKASNLLFEDYITPKVVFQKFKHLVMLKSDETAGVTLHLNDDIRLEKLSSDWERLRAYYYAEESDSYTLFTPYMPSKSKEIINLLKTI